MKLKITFLSITVIFTTIIEAQRFQGGILGGINATQIDGDYWGGYHKGGLNFGAFVTTNLKDKWGGLMEIKYSAKGSSNASPVELQMVSLRYIDIPVLATYQIKNKLQVQGGLSFNYLFNQMLFDGDWYKSDRKYNKIESAIAAGIEYKVLQNVGLNLRYCYSFTPVLSKYSTSSNEGSWFNNVLSFSVYLNINNN
jgi:opacity protein-like surface antigen